jgi:phospholipid/cholesterol/gamma-HCH transport system substrate-binding protein
VSQETRECVVGAAVIVLFALVLTYSYGGSRLKPAGGYLLDAAFNRVDGIAVGDEVRLAGIKVGSVDGQRLDDQHRAVLSLRLDSAVRLPVDTGVAIHTDGLFGTKFVVLDAGGEEDLLEPGDEIEFTQDSMRIDELLELIIAEGTAQRKKLKDDSANAKD